MLKSRRRRRPDTNTLGIEKEGKEEMSKSKKIAPSLATRGNQAAEHNAPKESKDTMSDNEKPFKSKVHAVELALEKLGWDAMPAKLREYVREKFGLEMTTAHIGVNKTNILRKRGIIAGPGGSIATTVSVSKPVGRPRGSRNSVDRKSFISVDSFDTVRALLKEHKAETILEIGEIIEKAGVTQLREIVRLLS